MHQNTDFKANLEDAYGCGFVDLPVIQVRRVVGEEHQQRLAVVVLREYRVNDFLFLRRKH